MNVEGMLVAACSGVAVAACVLASRRAGGRVGGRVTAGLWVGLTAGMVATAFLGAGRLDDGERAVTYRPVQLPAEGYVGSAECRSCHPHEHATWHDSYHRTMTQVASPASVLGHFDDVRLEGKGLEVRLRKRGRQYVAELSLPERGVQLAMPVVLTTGSHHRQAYWMAPSKGSRELTILPYMFLREEQRWIPRHAGYINANGLHEYPELHTMAMEAGRWENGCIRCHTTLGRPDPPAGADGEVAGTQAAEFGISCEACHGPGGEHARANRNPLRRYGRRLTGGRDAAIVNPARLPHDRSAQVCGQCHSVIVHRGPGAYRDWLRRGLNYRPGDDLAADPMDFIVRGRPDRMPPDAPEQARRVMDLGAFWPDGMIRASGREYNGLLESPCYRRGEMSCLSCHRMHQAEGDPRRRPDWADDQLERGMDGNRACVQCHERFGDDAALTRHTHHAAGSPGSNCYNCHMPFTTYGILKAIRSHQVHSPSVQQSLEAGRPNACNQCHLDRTMGWAADHLRRWYGIPAPALTQDQQRIAAGALWALSGDAGLRALMAWSFGWADAHAASGNDWQAPYLAQLLEDTYGAVRLIARRSLRRLPGFGRFECDPVGTAAHRAEAHRRALQLWGARPGARPNPQVLLDGSGRVLEGEWRRLWGKRDDRPVVINE